MTPNQINDKLRIWISEKGKRDPQMITDDINLIETGILSSLDVLELILFIESLGGKTGNLQAGVFQSITTITTAFFPEKYHA